MRIEVRKANEKPIPIYSDSYRDEGVLGYSLFRQGAPRFRPASALYELLKQAIIVFSVIGGRSKE